MMKDYGHRFLKRKKLMKEAIIRKKIKTLLLARFVSNGKKYYCF